MSHLESSSAIVVTSSSPPKLQMFRAALKNSTAITSSILQPYSSETSNRVNRRVMQLLRTNQNWHRIIGSSELKERLSPEVVKDVIRESRGIDANRIFHFFNWCELRLGIRHELSSFAAVALALCNAGNYSGCRVVVRRVMAVFQSPLIVLGAVVKCFREVEESDPVIFDILVDSYRLRGSLVEACSVFLGANLVGYVLDMVSVNGLLLDLLKADMMDEFWRVCDGMVEADMVPDVHAYNTMIRAYCRWGNVDRMKVVFREMEMNGCEPTVSMYNMVIEALCETGNLDEAIHQKNDMVEKGLCPDSFTFKTLMDGFHKKKKRSVEARSLLSEMTKMGLKPDSVYYNSLIYYLFKERKFQEAFEVWNELRSSGVKMNLALYHSLLYGVSRAGKIDTAAEIVCEMIVEGINPDLHTYNMLIKGYFAKDNMTEAFSIFNAMKKNGLPPTLATYGLMISRLCRSRNCKLAFELFEEMIAKGLSPEQSVYETIIRAYAHEGMVDESTRVLKAMKDKRMLPELECYNNIIIGLCKAGRIEDVRTCWKELLDSGLRPNASTYEAMIYVCIKEGEIQTAEDFL